MSLEVKSSCDIALYVTAWQYAIVTRGGQYTSFKLESINLNDNIELS